MLKVASKIFTKVVVLAPWEKCLFLHQISCYAIAIKEMYDSDNIVAGRGAELRAKYSLRTPDALQMAAAIVRKTHYFLTNDARLRSVAEIQSMTLSELQ